MREREMMLDPEQAGGVESGDGGGGEPLVAVAIMNQEQGDGETGDYEISSIAAARRLAELGLLRTGINTVTKQ